MRKLFTILFTLTWCLSAHAICFTDANGFTVCDDNGQIQGWREADGNSTLHDDHGNAYQAQGNEWLQVQSESGRTFQEYNIIAPSPQRTTPPPVDDEDDYVAQPPVVVRDDDIIGAPIHEAQPFAPAPNDYPGEQYAAAPRLNVVYSASAPPVPATVVIPTLDLSTESSGAPSIARKSAKRRPHCVYSEVMTDAAIELCKAEARAQR